MTGSPYGARLFANHAKLLADSAISPEVADERGYVTVDTKKRLAELGFAGYQQRIPGMLVPVHDETGTVVLHQYRPDSPRTTRAGRTVKYETPIGATMAVDVPPRIRGQLGDPTIPLWVTEGVRKADSATTVGLCCLALLGVWNWRGTNSHGGKTVLAFWESVALQERRVYLCFDSDVMVKKTVHGALARLGAFLTRRGADVRYAYLPADSGAKVGLDDYLAAGGTAERLRLDARTEPLVTVQEQEQIPEPPPTNTPSDGSAGSDGSGGSKQTHQEPPENGADLLDEVRAHWDRYITVMREFDLDTLTLWPAHTHAAWRLYTTPRLQLDSPVPESGKTTVLEHLNRLAHRPVLASSISSPALLARLVADDPRTLLLDEVDRTLDVKTAPAAGEIIAILNSGYKVGATRPVLVPVTKSGWEVAEMSTFAPVAMAGNQPNLPDDTRSRTIRVLLLPDWQGRAAESDWELIDEQTRVLGARLARWVRQADLSHRPEMPPGVIGRFREKWLPLARVAHAAGGRWPQAVWDLAAADVEEVRQDREGGLAVEKPAVLLLRHIAESWPQGEDFWRTTTMVEQLSLLYPESWGKESSYGKALTLQRLGRLLVKSFRIRSTVEERADKKSPRGYWRSQFESAMGALARPSTSSDGSTGSLSEPPEPSEPAEPPASTASPVQSAFDWPAEEPPDPRRGDVDDDDDDALSPLRTSQSHFEDQPGNTCLLCEQPSDCGVCAECEHQQQLAEWARQAEEEPQ